MEVFEETRPRKKSIVKTVKKSVAQLARQFEVGSKKDKSRKKTQEIKLPDEFRPGSAQSAQSLTSPEERPRLGDSRPQSQDGHYQKRFSQVSASSSIYNATSNFKPAIGFSKRDSSSMAVSTPTLFGTELTDSPEVLYYTPEDHSKSIEVLNYTEFVNEVPVDVPGQYSSSMYLAYPAEMPPKPKRTSVSIQHIYDSVPGSSNVQSASQIYDTVPDTKTEFIEITEVLERSTDIPQIPLPSVKTTPAPPIPIEIPYTAPESAPSQASYHTCSETSELHTIESSNFEPYIDLGIWTDFKPSIFSGRVLKMVTEMGSASVGGISPALSANAAKSFLEATDKEKKELQGLNDRLGNYIDRVKRLEEQNRKLVADLDELRGKWGKDTSDIKIKYSESLSSARKEIDDSARRKAEIDVKVARLRDDLAEYRSRYEDVQHRREADREKISQWTNAIADAQSELEMLRARWKQLTDEEKRLNADNARIWEELQKARNDLDEETVGRIDFQNQAQTLLEELEFLRRIHEQEVKELNALLAQAPADTREFFKNELALAIRDIKDEYDYIAKQGKQDMESWYKLKVSEVQGSANRAANESTHQREEVKRMRDNIGDLRGKLGDLEGKNALLESEVKQLNYQLSDDQRQYEQALNERDATLRRMREECQALVQELQCLLDTKQMLDAEIAIYRKMLEGEESRVGLRQMVEQVVKTHSLQQQEDTDSTRSVRGEVSTKTTFQRSAKGNVTIAECDPNGKYITLENTHRTKDENLGEHKLKRKLDGNNRKEIVYTIPANTVLKAGKTMKIYARDQGGIHNPPDSLVFDTETTWGIGANVVTTLYNKEGDERAAHNQKTIQTGQ